MTFPRTIAGGAVRLSVGDLCERLVEHHEVVGGGVGTGVPRSQSTRQRLPGVGQEAQQRVETEAAFVGGYSLIFAGWQMTGVASRSRTSPGGVWPATRAADLPRLVRRASVRRLPGSERGPSVRKPVPARQRRRVAARPWTSRSRGGTPLPDPAVRPDLRRLARITAGSAAIRPRSWPAPRGRSCLNAVEYAAVGPMASAEPAGSRAPA